MLRFQRRPTRREPCSEKLRVEQNRAPRIAPEIKNIVGQGFGVSRPTWHLGVNVRPDLQAYVRVLTARQPVLCTDLHVNESELPGRELSGEICSRTVIF